VHLCLLLILCWVAAVPAPAFAAEEADEASVDEGEDPAEDDGEGPPPSEPDIDEPDDAVDNPDQQPPNSRELAEDPDKTKIEPAVLPGAGFNSNLGVSFGIQADVTAYRPSAEIYDWFLSTWLYASVRSVAGTLQFSRVVYWFEFDMPSLMGGRLRLLPRFFVRFFRLVGYYGLGNAAVRTEPWLTFDRDADEDGWRDARRFHEYERLRVFARADLRYQLRPGFDLYAGGGVSFSRYTVHEGSRLAQDLAGASGEWVQKALEPGQGPHATFDGQIGLAWDKRDDQADPVKGYFHEFSVRGGLVTGKPFGYVGFHGQARFYAPIAKGMFTFATRAIVDFTAGRPPLYELSEYAGLRRADALGGDRGMRGLAAWRYHGKIKVLGTAELRARFFNFTLFKRRASIGAVAFVDAGRVWADWVPRPELDGSNLGLHVTPGGGIRLRWGETFIIRADVGIGDDTWQLYVETGHVF
jgi:opacity protein-like surface antigen